MRKKMERKKERTSPKVDERRQAIKDHKNRKYGF
jgi:hypothetical protein